MCIISSPSSKSKSEEIQYVNNYLCHKMLIINLQTHIQVQNTLLLHVDSFEKYRNHA
jgi:hypothetical protein